VLVPRRHANICSLTSQGHAYAVLRRALDRKNPMAALAAAADLPHVGLFDALELCLLLRTTVPASSRDRVELTRYAIKRGLVEP